MSKHDLIAVNDLSKTDILTLCGRAGELSALWQQGAMPQSLAGSRIGLIAGDSGWRNTSALDLGIQSMGGVCVQLPIRFEAGEALEDLAGYLDNWYDLIAIRTPDYEVLRQMVRLSRKPILNLRCRHNHPCETLGDLSFLLSALQRIESLEIAVVAPSGNILQSWIEAASVLDIALTQIYHPRYFVPESQAGTDVLRRTTDMKKLRDADVIITDCWPAEGEANALADFKITAALLDETRPHCQFIPCPPVTRGKEVATDAMSHARYVSPKAKAYLLHIQNAYMEWVLS